MKHFSRVLAGIGLAIAGFAGASSAIAQLSSCTAGQISQQFSYTGAAQTLTVPAGVVSINMYISGAQGGSGGGANPGAGGLGGRVTGKLNVNAGDMLHVYVGGQGTVFNGAALGGNTGGGIGGGASDVRRGADLIANRVAVAGGGGGGGSTGCIDSNGTVTGGGGAGGIGGGGAGIAGGDSNGSGSGVAGGGAGGTLGAGGAAGIGCAGFLGQVGSNSGTGGNGQACCCAGAVPGGGGGGGGDVVGGGGGGGSAGQVACQNNSKGAGGGGGGGSSLATGLTETAILDGVQAGDGRVELCLTKGADLAITNTNSSTTAVIGATATYTILASNAGPSGVVSATVSHIKPAACTSLSWSCAGAGGATCTASGTGNINDLVSMPSGSTLTYLATCMVSASASGVLTGSASITAPSDVTDLNLANNSASGTATLVTQAVAQVAGGGGGCTMGSTDAPFDPSLPLLVLLAVAGILRMRRKSK